MPQQVQGSRGRGSGMINCACLLNINILLQVDRKENSSAIPYHVVAVQPCLRHCLARHAHWKHYISCSLHWSSCLRPPYSYHGLCQSLQSWLASTCLSRSGSLSQKWLEGSSKWTAATSRPSHAQVGRNLSPRLHPISSMDLASRDSVHPVQANAGY